MTTEQIVLGKFFKADLIFLFAFFTFLFPSFSNALFHVTVKITQMFETSQKIRLGYSWTCIHYELPNNCFCPNSMDIKSIEKVKKLRIDYEKFSILMFFNSKMKNAE